MITQDAALAARIEVQGYTVADLDRRAPSSIALSIRPRRRGKTNNALSAMEGQRKARAAPAGEWQREAEALAGIKTERTALTTKGRQIETEAAPIRYVAELVGANTDSERAIRRLIALMVLCADPLCDRAHGCGLGEEEVMTLDEAVAIFKRELPNVVVGHRVLGVLPRLLWQKV